MKRHGKQFIALVALVGVAALGGCTEGVLDPKGPIAIAERQILFNALGIMLAIVSLVVAGSLWIMADLNGSMMAPAESMNMLMHRR